jgi:pimeloyl-ACP methyl ester carboxylesterase
MRESMIDVRGQSLRLCEAGSGAPLLFLHGAGGPNWYPLLEMLSAHWHVIAPEHPGFGRSSLPEWMMGVGDLAYFYLDFLEARELRDVHLVGHSLGGWTAAEIAVRSTSRLRDLTLLAPAGTVSATTAYGDIFLWTPEEHARNSFFDQTMAEERIRALPNADFDVFLQNRSAAARLAWSPRLHNPQLPTWLHRIDVPTLLVWGREDRIVPFVCHEAFLKNIPGAQLATFPRLGHALHSERPSEVAARMEAFFAGTRV